MMLVEIDTRPALTNGATPPFAVMETPAAVPEPETPVAVLPPIAPRPLTNLAGTERRVFTLDAMAALKAATRRLVEGTDLPYRTIGQRVDLRPNTVASWARKEGWTRPPTAPRAPVFGTRYAEPETAQARHGRMMGKLYRIFERQAGDLETRAAKPLGESSEKDARTLGVLAKALETLTALDRDIGAKKTDDPEPIDRERINRELAERIERWARGGTEDSRSDPEPDA